MGTRAAPAARRLARRRESARRRSARPCDAAELGFDRALPRRLLRAVRRVDGRARSGARRDGRGARATVTRAALDDTAARARARDRQVGRGCRARRRGRRAHALGLLPHAAVRAAAGRGRSVPVQRDRDRPVPGRARAARAADAGRARLCRRARPHVQGGAGEPVVAAHALGDHSIPAAVPAAQGSRVAALDSGVRPIFTAVQGAARRGAAAARTCSSRMPRRSRSRRSRSC